MLEQKEQTFFPIIAEGQTCIQDAYNTYYIVLPCSIHSDLNWEKEKLFAQKVLEQGSKILWGLDFHLENKKFPLEHKMQFTAFKLAVQTFVDTLYTDFSQNTLGVCLYKGSADLIKGAQQIEDLDKLVSFLSLFFTYLPDSIRPFVFLDAKNIDNPYDFFQFFSKERFTYFTLIIKNHPLFPYHCFSSIHDKHSPYSLGYIGPNYRPQKFKIPDLGIAIATQKNPVVKKQVNAVFSFLQDYPLRVIDINYLIEIDQLNQVIIFDQTLNSINRRHIMGFCAAGGKVITVGALQGFCKEISWEEFKKTVRGRGI
jgi:hypothetical protein